MLLRRLCGTMIWSGVKSHSVILWTSGAAAGQPSCLVWQQQSTMVALGNFPLRARHCTVRMTSKNHGSLGFIHSRAFGKTEVYQVEM